VRYRGGRRARPIGIEAVDQVLVLRGAACSFGPKEQVRQVLQRVAPPSPIKIVSDSGASKS
jgi:ATP-binding cassette subfamily C protein